MIPACACENGYRKAVASGLLYAEGWVLRPQRILVHAGWCLDGETVLDPGFTEPAAAYFGWLDPEYIRSPRNKLTAPRDTPTLTSRAAGTTEASSGRGVGPRGRQPAPT
jgi:hypothetical protein